MKESIDNNIPEIRKEVERSFSGEQPPPPQLPPMGIDLIIRESVKKLMEADYVTFFEGIYSIPDVLFRMYLKRIGGKE